MLVIVTATDLKKMKERDFYLPIIKALQSSGGSAKKRKVFNDIVEENNFSEYALEQRIKSNGNIGLIENYVQWARFHLKVAGYLKTDSPWGVWELTEKGINTELDNVDLNEIEQSKKEYLSAKSQKSEEVEVERESIRENVIDQWKVDLINSLQEMTWQKFEVFARKLVAKMGVIIDEELGHKLSGDKGIDGYGYLEENGIRKNQVAIQAKKYNGIVGEPEVRDFIGAMNGRYKEASYGIFVSTSGYNKEAVKTARTSSKPITLIDSEKIIELVEQHKLYIEPIITYKLGKFYTNTGED